MIEDEKIIGFLDRLSHGPLVFFKKKAGEPWNMLAVTENVKDLCGYTEEQFQRRSITHRDIIHPEDMQSVVRKMTDYLDMQHATRYHHSPYRIIHHNGTIRWVREYGVIEYEDGRPSFLYGYLIDITAQKNNVDALMMESLKYRSFFEKHSSIFLLIDPVNGRIVKANRSASQFYGYSIEELEQMSISQINTLPRDEIKRRMEEADRLKQNYFVFPHRLASGEIRTVEVHSTPAQIYDREYLFSIIHDITDRVRLESELRELNHNLQRKVEEEIHRRTDLLRKYQLLFERAGVAIFLIQNDVFLDCNDAALDLFGLADRKEIRGRHPYDFAPPFQSDGQSSEERARQIFERARQEGRQQFTYLHRKADGTPIHVHVDLSRIDLDDGPLLYAMCHDITQETRSTDQKKDMERFLHQQTKVVGNLYSAFAHQWKESLNALSLMMQYLSELSHAGGLTREPVQSIVSDANAQIHSMLRMIDDLHDLLNSETEEKKFHVRSSILECVEVPGYQEATIETIGGDFEILGYPNRFKQVILHLLTNAQNAIRQRRIARPDLRGKIVIDIHDTLRKIDISDNGGGVPDDIAARIFEPSGNGISLYIVKMIVESMRGGIKHHNRKDGSCFTLQF
jgi:PAS domain S-box-containing protein